MVLKTLAPRKWLVGLWRVGIPLHNRWALFSHCHHNSYIIGQAATWCNVEGIQVFGCVIYTGNDEAARQAQGVFCGSNLIMELASERQADISTLVDYLSTVVK